MVTIRLRPPRQYLNPQSPEEDEPLRNISNNSSPQIEGRKTRKSASRIVMDIIDSPRRALISRSKRLKAGKMKHQVPFPIPNFIASHMDMDVDTDAQSNGLRTAATFDSDMDSCSWLSTIPALVWVEQYAPPDIVPKILSFAGPRQTRTLSRVNKTWNKLCTSEGVFRTLCEDYGKWMDNGELDCQEGGEDFWRKVYCDNPLVPLDYATVRRAAAATCKICFDEDQEYFECNKNIRILVQPGVYVFDQELLVETLGNATFSVETQENSVVRRDAVPTTNSSSSRHSPLRRSDENGNSPSPRRRRLNSGQRLRNMLGCGISADVENDNELDNYVDSCRTRDQATIVLKTKKRNCPIFHIRQGQMKLSKLTLIHNCKGTDIWNGNSAVQIQTRLNDRHHPIAPLSPDNSPSAIVEESKIMSISGRGIVAIDGSTAHVKNCHIHRCAATGIYIGGSGSIANITNSDIVTNGIGNKRSHQGIARGHSGVYLEQGLANLTNCNISENTLTGLSAVSQDNAILKIQDSDLVGNGTLQLEMPPDGSVSRARSTSINNRISQDGVMRLRSGLNIDDADLSDFN